MAVGILSVVLVWVPLIGCLGGIIAVWLFVVADKAFKRSSTILAGRGWAIAGLTTGLLGATTGAALTVQSTRLIDVRGHLHDPRFARHAGHLGTTWVSTRQVRLGFVGIDLYCEEDLFFAVFDDRLRMKQKEPIRLPADGCPYGSLRHNVFATDEGFGITYFRDNQPELASFDLKALKSVSLSKDIAEEYMLPR